MSKPVGGNDGRDGVIVDAIVCWEGWIVGAGEEETALPYCVWRFVLLSLALPCYYLQ